MDTKVVVVVQGGGVGGAGHSHIFYRGWGAFIAAPAFEKAGAAERGAGETWGVRWTGRWGRGGEPAHTCIAEVGNTCAPRGGGGGGGVDRGGCTRLIRG